MEAWSFPPQYDERYTPPVGSRYWFPTRETMPPAEREAAILARLKEVTRYAWYRQGPRRRILVAVCFRTRDAALRGDREWLSVSLPGLSRQNE